MQDYQKDFARLLADSGALFFADGLRLKDGRPTPYFVNLGNFRSGRLISLLGGFLADMIVDRGLANGLDVIIGPSYKGTALAVAIAQALWKNHGRDVLFDYDRKEVKAHGEATGRGSRMVTNALFSGANTIIVDDVATTMGTKFDLLDLLKAECADRGIEIAVRAVVLAVDRQQTTAVKDADGKVVENVKGQDAAADFRRKTGIAVHTLVGIRDMIEYLAAEAVPVTIRGERRPMDGATLKVFRQYVETYGSPA